MSIVEEITAELDRADAKHGRMQEMREGWFTLLIEVLELGREVFRKEKDETAMRVEAVQSGAMAIKFLRDVCDREVEQ